MPSLLNSHADERVHPRSQHQSVWFGHSTAAGMGAYHPGPQLAASGKAAVPRVPSMLFEMEMEESMQSSHADDATGSLHELRRYLLPLSTGEYKLRAEVEVAVARQQQQQQLQEQPPPDSMLDACHRLATHLSRKGYHVHVRQSLGGGDGFECLRNLRHVFLTVLPPGAHATTNRYIVDLSFKEQFRVAKPTPRYQALLECLPEVYVAPEAMVAPLVHLMCQEMALAFQANGAVLPPWREGKSMITRWNPRKSCDLAFPPLPHTALPASGAAAQKVLPPLPGLGKHPLLQQQEVRARIQEVLDAAVVDAVCKQQQAAVAGGIKPIACEPQRVMVGGNFSTVGFQ